MRTDRLFLCKKMILFGAGQKYILTKLVLCSIIRVSQRIKHFFGGFMEIINNVEQETDPPFRSENNDIMVGEVFKNWDSFCKRLGLPHTSGNSRKAQKKYVGVYYGYKKVKGSNEIVITGIHTPDEIERIKKENNSNYSSNNKIYGDTISKAVRANGDNEPSLTRTYTTTQLFYNLGMVNQNYVDYQSGKLKPEDMSNGYKHFDYLLKRITKEFSSKFFKVVQTELNNMVKEGQLESYSYGDIYAVDYEYHKTKHNELQNIEDGIFAEFDISRQQLFINDKLYSDFKKKLNLRLNELGYLYMFKVHTITYKPNSYTPNSRWFRKLNKMVIKYMEDSAIFSIYHSYDNWIYKMYGTHVNKNDCLVAERLIVNELFYLDAELIPSLLDNNPEAILDFRDRQLDAL